MSGILQRKQWCLFVQKWVQEGSGTFTALPPGPQQREYHPLLWNSQCFTLNIPVLSFSYLRQWLILCRFSRFRIGCLRVPQRRMLCVWTARTIVWGTNVKAVLVVTSCCRESVKSEYILNSKWLMNSHELLGLNMIIVSGYRLFLHLRCQCNGHADTCNEHDGTGCPCQNNTETPSCLSSPQSDRKDCYRQQVCSRERINKNLDMDCSSSSLVKAMTSLYIS